MDKKVIAITSALVGTTIGAIGAGKVMGDKANEWKKMSDKHLELFLLMNQWVKVKQDGKNLAEYFERAGYKRIAIYGMSYIGETLASEILGHGVNIAYGIDRKPNVISAEFEIVSPDGELEEVDAVVVTCVTFFNEIEEMLCNKVNCPIISLEDVLYEV